MTRGRGANYQQTTQHKLVDDNERSREVTEIWKVVNEIVNITRRVSREWKYMKTFVTLWIGSSDFVFAFPEMTSSLREIIII